MNFFKYLALIAVAAVGAVSCSDADTFTEGKTDNVAVLYASTPSEAVSKLGFTENSGGTEISLNWEDKEGEEDTFIIYSSDDTELTNKLATFYCSDAINGEFTSTESFSFTPKKEYKAVYGSLENIKEQNGDEIANLEAACHMTSEAFTYPDDGTAPQITFSHQTAIMTFKFESDELPAYLIFENGDESYKVTYSTITADATSGLYTSHIMIKPCAASTRNLTFSLYDSDDLAYDVRTVETDKAYLAGSRYVSPVSSLENSVWNGSGTAEEPYEIGNAAQLRALSDSVNSEISYAGIYFTLTNDIDLGGIVTTETASLSKSSSTVSTTIVADNEFTAIGTNGKPFSGTFDGGGFEVSGLYINQPSTNYQGLFGYISSATIKNLGVSGSVSGYNFVGGITGYSVNSTIINCYNKASISAANSAAGGIVGYDNNSSETKSYVYNCYNSGSIYASSYAGGIFGYSAYTYLFNCYNSGSISGTYCGGIVGYGTSNVYPSYCYNSGSISGTDCGGIVGYVKNNVTLSNCYYDNTDTNISNSYGSINSDGYDNTLDATAVDMTSDNFLITMNNNSYIYNQTSPSVLACAWVKDEETSAYPMIDYTNTSPIFVALACDDLGAGTSSVPYQIKNASQLRDLATQVNAGTTFSGKYFEMMNDIDLGGSSNEFAGIGVDGKPFSGTFDGGGFEVSGLYINLPSSGNNYKGLFGYISSATIKNLGVSGSVSGYNYVGGITGYTVNSTIINCYNKASIRAENSAAGGIVGLSNNSYTNIYNCYNSGSIYAYFYAGGIAGRAYYLNLSYCYNWGSISGVSHQGGIVGDLYSASSASNCYYDSSKSTLGYGKCQSDVKVDDYEFTGLTTSEMQGEYYLIVMNNNAYTYNLKCSDDLKAYAWITGGENAYPMIDYTNDNPSFENITCDDEGAGTAASPYLIRNDYQLRDLATQVNAGTTFSGKYFEMMNDIDLGGSSNEFAAIGTSSSNSFRGTFDGGGFVVSGLYINQTESSSTSSYQGFFGYVIGATIKNLAVSGSVTGYASVGGIAGLASHSSTFINCYNEVSVNATSTGESNAGGVVGYSIGNSATEKNSIYNCYNSGSIKSSGKFVGGVIGNASYSDLQYCYSLGSVTATGTNGGILGKSANSTVASCYYDSNVYTGSGCGTSDTYSVVDITGVSTETMKSADFLVVMNNNSYDYNRTNPSVLAYAWKGGSDAYPEFDTVNAPTYVADIEYDTANSVYNIYTASGMEAFAGLVNGETVSGDVFIDNTTSEIATYFTFGTADCDINGKLMNNIDLEGSSTNLWTPIGTGEDTNDTYTAYAGVFDGDGYSIAGLYVVDTTSYQGLFGSVVNGTVKNLSVGGTVKVTGAGTCGLIVGYSKNAEYISCTTLAESSVSGEGNNIAGITGYTYNTSFTDCHNNASVNGVTYTGGIAGWCNSAYLVSFNNCSNSGTIYSTGNFVGGIAGKIFGTSSVVHTITNCSNTGYVSVASGCQYVGGLVGANQGGVICNSYNQGKVSGSTNVGGLVGIIEDNVETSDAVTCAKMVNCYTTGEVTGTTNVGLAVGNCDLATIASCYYNGSLTDSAIGTDNNRQSLTYYSTSYMQSEDFVTLLNNGVSAFIEDYPEVKTWTKVVGSYPILNK